MKKLLLFLLMVVIAFTARMSVAQSSKEYTSNTLKLNVRLREYGYYEDDETTPDEIPTATLALINNVGDCFD